MLGDIGLQVESRLIRCPTAESVGSVRLGVRPRLSAGGTLGRARTSFHVKLGPGLATRHPTGPQPRPVKVQETVPEDDRFVRAPAPSFFLILDETANYSSI